jgi:ABC-type nitrate/sulfonate/bicarbonate transport system permease component
VPPATERAAPGRAVPARPGASAAYRVIVGEQIISILSPLLLVALWEALVRFGALDARFFPAPSSIVGTFTGLITSGELAQHVGASLRRVLLGFLVGGAPALLLGVVMGLSRWARAALNPIIAATYPIPKSAILPLVMLIFGLGDASKVALVAIGVFYLVLINTVAGVLTIPPIFLDVGRNFGASRLVVFRTIALPGALPLIFAGLRLGLGIGLILIVIAEIVGARSGIGYMIWQAWTIFQVERMYVGLVVIAILGWLVALILDYVERILIPWKPRR